MDRSLYRTVASLCGKEPVELVWTSDEDGGILGASNWENILWQTQNMLEGLHITSGNTTRSLRESGRTWLGKTLPVCATRTWFKH